MATYTSTEWIPRGTDLLRVVTLVHPIYHVHRHKEVVWNRQAGESEVERKSEEDRDQVIQGVSWTFDVVLTCAGSGKFFLPTEEKQGLSRILTRRLQALHLDKLDVTCSIIEEKNDKVQVCVQVKEPSTVKGLLRQYRPIWKAFRGVYVPDPLAYYTLEWQESKEGAGDGSETKWKERITFQTEDSRTRRLLYQWVPGREADSTPIVLNVLLINPHFKAYAKHVDTCKGAEMKMKYGL